IIKLPLLLWVGWSILSALLASPCVLRLVSATSLLAFSVVVTARAIGVSLTIIILVPTFKIAGKGARLPAACKVTALKGTAWILIKFICGIVFAQDRKSVV